MNSPKNVTHMTKNVTHVMLLFLELLLINSIFPKILAQCYWQVFYESKQSIALLTILLETLVSLMWLKLPKLLFPFIVTHVMLFQNTAAEHLL